MNALLQGRYEIIQTLSAGGFGETFVALDRQLPSQRKVVIKKFKPQQQYDARTYEIVRERFEREAAVLESLSDVCRHVPKLYAFFSEAGDYYLVQEFIEGQTLNEFVRAQGRLDEATTRQLLTSLLKALHEIHAQGIIHRDIKPDNILLRASTGQPVLIDFGAVKEIVTTVLDAYGTPQQSSLIIGTPGYAPAEQSVGRPVYASDLYSLAMTMIFALTGRQPHELNDLASGELRWRQYTGKLSQPLTQSLERAIQYDYRERFKNAKEMLDALNVALLVKDFTDIINGVNLEMKAVPAGSFLMGSPDNEAGRSANEEPQRRVNIAAFAIGKYPITQAQWRSVMGDNPSGVKGDNLPVECVSWNDAKEFCQKLSQLTGKAYRLPTEAEWEYACRAGTTGAHAGELKAIAWYVEYSTLPVGQKQANAFGLFDMHGNVWEWCEDVWHQDYDGAPTDDSAWLSGGDSRYHVVRGGGVGLRYCVRPLRRS
ncbi:MAG: SUMF1/EgtB/PvdO family nonheme iron enzyme [Acidobacteria bacterium]|nr:SUMF1/EgtB/PvdO family nonheme iron enzyme [Acidobacteriota bacterium]